MSGSYLRSRLPKIAAELEPVVHKAITEGLQPIAQQAQANGPEDTFFEVGVADASDDDLFIVRAQQMADVHSFDSAPERITGGPGVTVAVGIYASWYYFFKEHGTVNETARPFLTPAWEEGKEPMMRHVRKAIGNL